MKRLLIKNLKKKKKNVNCPSLRLGNYGKPTLMNWEEQSRIYFEIMNI